MSIEAMKQALQALELMVSYEWLTAFINKEYDSDEPQENEMRELVLTAITSLRQAIAEAEKQEPVGIVDSTISGHIDWLCTFFPKQGTKLHTHPQPKRRAEQHKKQEPVAWLRTSAFGSPVVTAEYIKLYPEHAPRFQQPLYTHPQPAQPKEPLTNEEIAEICLGLYGSGIHHDDYVFVRAIEAAHGIKE